MIIMNTIKRHLYKFLRIILKSVMIVFLIVFMGWIWWVYLYGRGVYKLGNEQYVTIWKRPGGCYVMPYKYCGFMLPSDKNFILDHNLGTIRLFKEDSTLLIYDEAGEKDKGVKGIYLPDYKYEYIDYPYFDNLPGYIAVDSMKVFYQEKEKRVKHLPELFISIREPWVVSKP